PMQTRPLALGWAGRTAWCAASKTPFPKKWRFTFPATFDIPLLTDYGESIAMKITDIKTLVGCVEDFKPLVLGRDPTRIEFLWQIMYRHSFWRLGVIGTTAMSAIEQACWDITGKSLGVLVYKLLGGRVRDKVRMYTHLGMGEMKAVYETSTVEPLIERAQALWIKGYRAIKVVVVPISEPLMGLPAVRHFA